MRAVACWWVSCLLGRRNRLVCELVGASLVLRLRERREIIVLCSIILSGLSLR